VQNNHFPIRIQLENNQQLFDHIANKKMQESKESKDWNNIIFRLNTKDKT